RDEHREREHEAGRHRAGAVPAFTWRTDAGDKPYRLDRFQQVVRTVMGRRDVEPSPAYSERIAALHANASH
ncbi:MAG: hypothetical protein AAGK04_07930, partial [Planctomycetota bacterium]